MSIKGIDYPSIFRALYKDTLAGGKVEGGSTITQQLAKNVFLTREKNIYAQVEGSRNFPSIRAKIYEATNS